MNYAIISNGTITASGSASELWPDTSFSPAGPNASFLSEVGAVKARSDVDYDPDTEIRQPVAPYLLNGEVFDTIAAPLPPPEPSYTGLHDDVISDPVYKVINEKAALFQPLLAASTEFTSALGDAKQGNVKPEAVQEAIWKLMHVLQPSDDEKAAFQAILEKNSLADTVKLDIPEAELAAFKSRPDPISFYQGIMGSNFYQKKLVPIILSGESSVPGDVTTLVAFAINDARSGLVPPPKPGGPPNSLQSAIWLFMTAMGPQMDEADLAEMQALLDATNLSSMYVLTPPP